MNVGATHLFDCTFCCTCLWECHHTWLNMYMRIHRCLCGTAECYDKSIFSISQTWDSLWRQFRSRYIYILFSVWTYRARDYRWVCALACVRAHTRMYVLFHFWQINSLKLAWSRRFLKIQVFTNSLNTITLLKYGYSTTRSKQTLIVNIIRFIIIQLTIL